MRYLTSFATRTTPQRLPIPGSSQVPNSAGGFAFAVDDWTRLDRFLVLGNEGGSYYATEQKLTRENAEAVLRCLQADGLRTVKRIVAISLEGRAPKNDPAIFALALAAALGDEPARLAALEALPRVCRTGTHLFHFVRFVEQFRGWGRGLRRAIGSWYNGTDARDLAFQAIKYQERDGWGHRDLLRLAHPVPASEQHKAIAYWITRGWEWVGDEPHPDPTLLPLWAFERAKRATSVSEVVHLVREYRLPREAVPAQWLAHAAVWEALLDDMPMTALIRNLATLTRIGLVAPGSDATQRVVAQLGDTERLRRARVHPIAVLAALTTYASGRGMRSRQVWEPVQPVVDALDAAFYASSGNVRSTGRRWLLALDVSGSMGAGVVAGVPGLTPRIAAAALALVTAAVEPEHTIVGFTAAASGKYGGQFGGGDPSLTPIGIGPRDRLDAVVRQTAVLPMGGTDCALPMVWALEKGVAVDVFVVLTDSATWAGATHPVQALRRYREGTGIPAKLVVCAMVSNGFSIADPNDAGMLDVVGFDTATPNLIADFACQPSQPEGEPVAAAA
jgi:60 kDa SS-A/Ro ribonucleoprotein